jgi:3-oxoacyl-[acyl-carrier protein] reductase/bacilysin biosynthesis oxidoreductase BacG
MNLNLQGKAALVTGGSKGIGKAIAAALAAEGARVAICGRDERVLQQTVEEIQAQTRSELIAVKANLTKLNDIRRFISTAAKKFNRIDILVNNAGGGHIGTIATITDEEWEYHIQLKLLGYIRTAREAIPYMKENGGGKIINIIGMAARDPNPNYMLPGVTNAALMNFTKSLSKTLENDRISVNAINPGTTETPLADQIVAALSALTLKPMEEIKTTVASSFPHGRIATTDDIAKVAVFLASDMANFINGVTINVDDGKTTAVW